MENNRPRRFISPETIREEIEGSLRRIGRDWIDLYQIHWPEPMENLVESWQALQDLKKEGKVRWVGVCNCWTDELEILSDISTITSNQPMYSMLARKVEQDVLPWCERHETGVLAYSPMHSGLLTGKVSKAWLDSLPANDWRKHKTDHPVVEPLQSEDGMKAFLDFQDQLKAFGQETGRTVGQVAVAWTLRRDEITSSIVGARRKGQIVETVKAVDLELLPDEQVFLGGLLEGFSGDY
jgi:aryl-alcohol dehydrogenase-like predicted oxidoreductase